VRYLVTGGAGLIGSHIVDQLLRRGDDVRILDNLNLQTHASGRPLWVSPQAEFVEGDVRDVDCVRRSLAGVEGVYHQAAFGGFTDSLSTYYDQNATGTARLFEGIESAGTDLRKVVVASSQAVYGEGMYTCPLHGRTQPPMRRVKQFEAGEWELVCLDCGLELVPDRTEENARANGDTPYAISKLSQERTTLGLGRRLGLPTVALRYAVTFGPRQSVFNPYTGIISIFSTLLLNGVPPTVFEDGRQTRDFVFVEDVAKANILAMQDDRANGRVFNVSRGESIQVLDLVRILAGAYELEPDWEMVGEFRPDDVRHLVLDPTSLEGLGWSAQVRLEDGILAVVDWIRSLGELDQYFRDALDRLRRSGVVRAASAG
jgi:dTDP-L-rhamnose 4-epimerase